MGDVNQVFNWGPLLKGEEQFLEQGSFILLFNLEYSPPHIMLCHNGLLFDWTHSSVRSNLPLVNIFSQFLKKEKRVLAIQIKTLSFDICQEMFQPLRHKEFDTCLGLITKVMENSYGLIFRGKIIFDVYQELKEENLILALYEWNINSSNFEMQKYTLEKVYQKIDELKNDKRR